MLILIGLANQSNAQLTANFFATPPNGCSPIQISFFDLSGGALVTYRLWEFNNPNNVSNAIAPTATFNTPGVYPVKLTVANSTDTADTTINITVFGPPTAAFSFNPSSGCPPFTVNFSDNSSTGTSAITGWSWNFGDGTQSNQSNPAKTYSSTGNFPVSLLVTDANGCTSTANVSPAITVTARPTASFLANTPRTSCTAPLAVGFSNMSTGNSALSYQWFFPGGTPSTSNVATPIVNYNSQGSFDVTLITTDASGCKDTLTLANYVIVQQPAANFTVPSPDTFCAGADIQFNNTSTAYQQAIWSFGDGNSSTNINPIHAFAAGGIYNVQLIAGDGGNCSDTVVKQVFVEGIIPRLSVDTSFNCSPPVAVSYRDSSITNYSSILQKWWQLGEFNPNAPMQNKTVGDTFTYYFNSAGIFTDTLIAITQFGCTLTHVFDSNVIVQPEQGLFTANRLNGCAPLATSYNNLSTLTTAATASTIWYFGTGDSSLATNPNYVFQSDGTFTVQLVITDTHGCIDTGSLEINVGVKPVADFYVVGDSTCADSAYRVVDTSQAPGPITFSIWEGNDGSSNSGLVAGLKAGDTGWVEIKHIAGYNGCYDTIIKPMQMYVKGPIVAANWVSPCNPSGSVQFNATMKDVDRFYWVFGDSSAVDSVNTDPLHIYPQAQNYLANITAYNDSTGCDFINTQNVNVSKTVAVIATNKTAFCVDENVLFNSFNSLNVASQSIRWYFSDGDSLLFANQATHAFSDTGWQQIILVVSGPDGCTDTGYANIRVFQPYLRVSQVVDSFCAPIEVLLDDSIQSDTNIVSIFWQLGPQLSDTADTAGPIRFFDFPGAYPFEFTVVDTFGCRSSLKDTIRLFGPVADFNADTSFCFGLPWQPNNLTSGISVNYLWDFGDVSGANLKSPNHQYADTGSYKVVLYAQDSVGCTDTAFKVVNVRSVPKAGVSFSNLDTNCAPLQLVIADTSQYFTSVTREWDFGEGNGFLTVFTDTIFNVYEQPGNYTIQYRITNIYGCGDTLQFPGAVSLSSPAGDFSLTADSLCIGDSVDLVFSNIQNVFGIAVDFGDGISELLDSNALGTGHRYSLKRVGLLNPRVIFSDSAGNCPVVAEDTLYIDEILGQMVLSDSNGCEPLQLIFQSQAGQRADIFDWAINGSSVSKNEVDSVQLNEGAYKVRLVVESTQSVCADSVTDSIEVYGLPQISAWPDTTICEGDTIALFAAGGVNYGWQPNGSLSSDSGATVNARPLQLKQYQIIGADSNGCMDTTELQISIVLAPTLPLAADTTIVVGDTGQVYFNLEPNLVFAWDSSFNLSCSTCIPSRVWPLATEVFNLNITDTLNCFQDVLEYTVNVRREYTVDVPNTFTPNGDGFNDKIFVEGWGIKELVEFKIYNRWGELVFFTDDIDQGWDGIYKGVPQNMDSYAFTAKAIGYDDVEREKSGVISLVR